MSTPDQLAVSLRTRVVPQARIDEFRDWADAMDASAAASLGHRGSVRLEQGGGLVHLLHQFDDAAARDRWEGSADHARLIADGERFPVERHQYDCGARLRFLVPSESAASKPKMWLATWLTVFPLLLGLSTAARMLLRDWPQPLQLALTSLIMTATLTWIVLPRVNRLLRPWQLSQADGEARR